MKKGFTLLELLVVIAIIGLLSSVVFASLNSAREQARDSERLSELKQMQTALELYRAENTTYPGNDGWIIADGGSINQSLVVNNSFLPSLPMDPTPDNSHSNGANRDQNFFYMYYGPDSVGDDRYCFFAQLEKPNSSTDSRYNTSPYKPAGVGGYGMNYALCN